MSGGNSLATGDQLPLSSIVNVSSLLLLGGGCVDSALAVQNRMSSGDCLVHYPLEGLRLEEVLL